MTTLSIRVDLDDDARLGPGKILLLERIALDGSIAAAGRSMAMSYRRAWELVAEMNLTFRRPVVAPRMGGRRGGGASLTPLGAALVAHYRAIERKATAAVEPHLRALEAAAVARRASRRSRGHHAAN